MPRQGFPVEEHHEVRQLRFVVTVEPDLAHQVHAHRVTAERKKQAVTEAQNTGVAPDQVHRQRADRVAHNLANQADGEIAHVKDTALWHHQVEQRREHANDDQGD